MRGINFHLLQPGDEKAMELLAGWYLSQWKIPVEKTMEKLKTVAADASQFQAILTLDGIPVATGGMYHHISLLDKEPRFRVHTNWLALVYTVPEMRHKGYGALLCNYIADHAKSTGVKEMHLFTDTAESLYKRLGWEVQERLPLGERNIVVMKKGNIE